MLDGMLDGHLPFCSRRPSLYKVGRRFELFTLLALQLMALVLVQELLEPELEPLMAEPPSREMPANMSSTEICSHCRKVRSFAKNVLGSTRVRTRALDLREAFFDPFVRQD